jgi:DNA-binding NtrC family response regulator
MAATTAPEQVLVVDDDPSAREYASLALRMAGYAVNEAANGVEALLALEQRAAHLVLCDLQMPVMDGLQLLTRIRERWPEAQVIILSVEHGAGTIVEAVQGGAVNYLVKPVAPAVLLSAAAHALARARRDPAALHDDARIPEIVGISPAVVHVRHLVALASRSDVNVLIVGETGTGKELVARAIHRLSGASSGPFLAHNCALTPAEMFDSEFFGHRRGAFTGADRDRSGILRESHGGVLFLDELECLTPAHQAKLLRVIDDGEVRPVGSDQSRQVSVRFVAATNRRPELMLAERGLREDLYYRLRGFQIELPPLRSRTGDIPLLAAHFVAQRGKKLSARAVTVLARRAWPGNVRELRNFLRSACSVAETELVDIPHLELVSSRGPLEAEGAAARAPGEATSLLEQAERETIERALQLHDGNLSRAAADLGIHRSTLRRKLRQLRAAPRRRA